MTTANVCSNCDAEFGNNGDVSQGLCALCLPPAPEPARPSDDDLINELVEKASIPNLASVLRKAREQGLIAPSPNYP